MYTWLLISLLKVSLMRNSETTILFKIVFKYLIVFKSWIIEDRQCRILINEIHLKGKIIIGFIKATGI